MTLAHDTDGIPDFLRRTKDNSMNVSKVIEHDAAQDSTPGKVVFRQEMAPMAAADSILAIVSRAATDPAFDVDKVERLMQMYERQKAQQAKTAYMAALS